MTRIIDPDVLTIRKVERLAELQDIWRIAHDQYVSEGYADPQPDGFLRHYPDLDFCPGTTILVAETAAREFVGTISLTVDGPWGLPVDKDFSDLAAAIRLECESANRTLGACWRLATRARYRNDLNVMMKLMSMMCEELDRQKVHTLLLTINPKHAHFYARMFGIQAISGPRDSGTVKQAPAILMRGSLALILSHWNNVKKRRVSARLKSAGSSSAADSPP